MYIGRQKQNKMSLTLTETQGCNGMESEVVKYINPSNFKLFTLFNIVYRNSNY